MNMLTQAKKRMPVKQGLYTSPLSPKKQPALIACKCSSCGEIYFPKRDICQNCQNLHLDEIILSRIGKIFSYVLVMQRPASHYKGSVPYAFGWVELPDGVRVETLFTGCKFEKLQIGMEVELVFEKLHNDDELNEIICHKFRPIKGR